MNADTSTPTHGWRIRRIWDITEAKFGKRPCWFQIQTALAIYEGKDVVGSAPTGAGKTLSFWMPLLMALEDEKNKMSFVVTVGYKVTQRLLVRNQNNSGKNILTIYSPQEWSATTNNKQVDV